MMFKRIKRILTNARNLNENTVLRQVLREKLLQAQILDLNTNDQLFEKGVDADDKSLGEYSPATIHGTANFPGKIEKGQRYDHVTLKDTEEFYRSFRLANLADGFTIQADAIKDGNDLTKLYGPQILGLTKESRRFLAGEMAPRVTEEVRKRIKR